METIRTTLHNAHQAHAALMTIWSAIKPWLMAGHRLHVEIKADTRSLAQNSRLWAMLTAVSRQVDWYGQKLSAEDWKHVMSAALKKQRVVPGIDGGFVVLGSRTSKMTIAEMSEMQDLIEAFMAERGVEFHQEETA